MVSPPGAGSGVYLLYTDIIHRMTDARVRLFQFLNPPKIRSGEAHELHSSYKTTGKAQGTPAEFPNPIVIHFFKVSLIASSNLFGRFIFLEFPNFD